MSIAENLITTAEKQLKINEGRKRIKKAILGRGGEISLTAGLKDLPDAIFNIPADNSLSYYTDEEIAYKKIVPNGAEDYALLKQLGGMTYKCTNLFDISKVPDINGITNLGNELYLTKTSTSSTKRLKELCPSLKVGDTATISLRVTNIKEDTKEKTYIYLLGANVSWTSQKSLAITQEILDSIVYFYFRTSNHLGDTEITAGTISEIQVSHGTELPPYEPFYEGLRDTKVTEIVSKGANLFDIGQIESCSKTLEDSKESYGIVDDDILIAKLGFYQNTYAWTPFEIELEAGKYTISADAYISTGGAPSLGVRLGMRRFNPALTVGATAVLSNYDNWERASVSIEVKESGKYYLQAQGTGNAEQYKNMDVRFKNICVTKTTNTEYKPYRESISYPILEAVQGNGKGINNYCDTIDFENRKLIQKCSTIIFDGTEKWQQYLNVTGVYWLTITGKAQNFQTSICSHFRNTNYAWAEGFMAGNYSDNTNNIVYFRTTQTSLDEWKTYLAEQYNNGNPVTLTYALAEPIETELSESLDNFLSVEGGGSLEFVNEYEKAVPSTIAYIKKVVTN